MAKREFETIFEEVVPPVPDREMELEYLGFLQNSFKNDPWITYRFRKYIAGPKRIPWTNCRELVIRKRRTFACNMILGGLLFYPVSCAIGRRMKYSQGGVPAVVMPRFVHDFPNVTALQQSKILFRKWSILASLTFGFLFAKYRDEPNGLSNSWYNRPDFKPYPAMVKKEGIAKENEEFLYQTVYPWRYAKNWKQTALYRFFLPEHADWTLKSNPYRKMNAKDVFDVKDGHYVSHTNDFKDHLAH